MTYPTLVKWECGCIGFREDGNNGACYVIERCDMDRADNDAWEFSPRPGMDEKSYTPLSWMDTLKLMHKLKPYVFGGARLKEIKLLLEGPV
jgi:hypothetical protein